MYFSQKEIRIIHTAKRWVRWNHKLLVAIGLAFQLLSLALLFGVTDFETISPWLYVIFAITAVGACSAQSPRYEVLAAILSEKLAQHESDPVVEELVGRGRKV